MEKYTISPEELQDLYVAHKEAKKCGDVRAAYRINVIIAVNTGWTYPEVAEILLLDEDTIGNYVNAYKEGKLEKLLETAYKGSGKLLTEEQLQQLGQELTSKVYLTTKEICDYVYASFTVTYSISGMTNLLHTLGYVYKKPKLVAANPDHEAQELFIQQYIDFMATKKENEAVFFVDAVHPVHNSTPACGWIKKGENVELKSNTGRSRLNIHGAMNAETFETTIVAGEDSVNAESTIQLLQCLEKIYPFAAVIYLILDNARYHFSREVQAYLAQANKFRFIFLPVYSPELNLIERLWRVLRKNVLYNKFYATYGEFKRACMDFFENQLHHYDEIVSIMGNGLHALAAI